MNKSAIVTPLIYFSAFTISCTDKGVPIESTPIGSNLVSNPSFESNGQPSSSGWLGFGNPMATFSIDVPQGGGSYSASIPSTWPAGLVRLQTGIPAIEGTHIYRFGVWAKYAGPVSGEIHFSVLRAGAITLRKTITITDTVWSEYSTLDTVASVPGDTLLLRLFGGGDPVSVGDSYFDLCTLERVN
ncbi:MAG: carbohydrate binding domain-containing protein [Bacteroidetes bacterium]|nr:carbohydrate binding domain-containing protein [Bacteroidota bacterium]MCW5895992.1 carbohydrate binding domain-containing protein [Bacteroidota bacterium]